MAEPDGEFNGCCGWCGAPTMAPRSSCVDCGRPPVSTAAPSVPQMLTPPVPPLGPTQARPEPGRAKAWLVGAGACVTILVAVAITAAALMGGAETGPDGTALASDLGPHPDLLWELDGESPSTHVAGDLVVIHDGDVTTAYAASGEEVWHERGLVADADEEHVIVTGGPTFSDSLDPDLRLLDAATGAEIWTAEGDYSTVYRLTAGGVLVDTGHSGAALLALGSGEEVWSTDGVRLWSVPDSDGNALFIDEDMGVQMLSLADGAEQWRYDVDFSTSDHYGVIAALSGGVIAIQSHDVIVGIDVETGAELWRDTFEREEDEADGWDDSVALDALPDGQFAMSVMSAGDDGWAVSTLIYDQAGESVADDRNFSRPLTFTHDGEEHAYLPEEFAVVDGSLTEVAEVHDVRLPVEDGLYTLDGDTFGYVPFGSSTESWSIDLGNVAEDDYLEVLEFADRVIVTGAGAVRVFG